MSRKYSQWDNEDLFKLRCAIKAGRISDASYQLNNGVTSGVGCFREALDCALTGLKFAKCDCAPLVDYECDRCRAIRRASECLKEYWP